MKRFHWFSFACSLILFSLIFTSCKEEETFLDEMEVIEEDAVLFEGTFQNSARYETSGTAKIILNEDNSRSLILSDFRTDPGPDLKVYLSTDTSASDFVSLGELKATSGSFSYDLPENLDLNTQNQVLIWCEDFSVLFGNAELMER